VTASVAVEGPIKKDSSSYILSIRSTYSDWLLRQIRNPDIRNSSAHFYDLAGGIHAVHNEKNQLKVFGYHSKDEFSLASSNHYAYSNLGGSLKWWHKYSPRLTGDHTAVVSGYSFRHENNTLPIEAYVQDYRIAHTEFRSDFLWVPFIRQKFNFGTNLILYQLDRGSIRPSGRESLRRETLLGEEQAVEGAIYLSDQIQVTEGLTVNTGLRYSIYRYRGPGEVLHYFEGTSRESGHVSDTLTFSRGEPIKSYAGPELRVSMNQRMGTSSSVKFSYGRTRQYLFMLSSTIAISPTDQWKLSDYHIRPAIGDQFSLGYYRNFHGRDINFSAEVYYKKTIDIVDYKDHADFIASPHMETEVLQGLQKAYGIEFLLRKNKGKWTGWISGTWSRTRIRVDGEYFWEKINQGNWYPANYDIPLALNAVMNYRVNRRLSISGNMVYQTGRPITYPSDVFEIDRKSYLIYDARNASRIPDYFRMDLSFNLEGNLRAEKLGHSYWMLNFYNLSGRKNAYSVFFAVERNQIKGYKLSVFSQPLVTLSWNFKFGNYASD
jgi:hypothetical protein